MDRQARRASTGEADCRRELEFASSFAVVRTAYLGDRGTASIGRVITAGSSREARPRTFDDTVSIISDAVAYCCTIINSSASQTALYA